MGMGPECVRLQNEINKYNDILFNDEVWKNFYHRIPLYYEKQKDSDFLDIVDRKIAADFNKRGQNLYDAQSFNEAGIDLQFIEMQSISYFQKSNEFIPYLSIIDVLMNVGVEGVKEHLEAFELKT